MLSTLTTSTMPPLTQFSILSNSSEGSKLGFIELDFKNIRQDYRVEVVSYDIDLLVSHFRKKGKEPNSYYSMSTDLGNIASHLPYFFMQSPQ